MTEEDRLFYVEKITQIIEKQESLNKKNNQIKELETDEKVKEYIDLKKETERLNKELQVYDGSKEEVIQQTFLSGSQHCEHELCELLGSFFAKTVFDGRKRIFNFRCDNEYDERFEFNYYRCIECGEDIKTNDWKKFESEHLVLNRPDYVHLAYEYRQLLFENTVEETKKILVNKYGLKR